MNGKGVLSFLEFTAILKMIPFYQKAWVVALSAAAVFFILSGIRQVRQTLNVLAVPYEETIAPASVREAERVLGEKDGRAGSEEARLVEAVGDVDGVEGVTAFWSMPVMLDYKGYRAEANLCGISQEYLDKEEIQGTAFMPNQAMPQCVLSTSVVNAFRSAGMEEQTSDIETNMLISDPTLALDGRLDIKVVGIIGFSGEKGGGLQPAELYMEASKVREMLAEKGSDVSVPQLRIRFADYWSLEKAKDHLAELGVNVMYSYEDAAMVFEGFKVGTAYIVCGSMCLASGMMLMLVFERLLNVEECAAYDYLTYSSANRHVFKVHRLMRLGITLSAGAIFGFVAWYLVGQRG